MSYGWTSYNYPSSVSTSGESATFDYGPDRARWRMSYTGRAGLETTYYASPLFEKVIAGGVTDFRHYIYAGNRPVVVISRTSAGAITVRSLLLDHQGSVATIVTESTGAALVFYCLRQSTGSEYLVWTPPTSGELSTMNGVTREGYTFQTVLGSMGLNHMNGRIQDAVTGRFLSADPFVQNSDTQSFNPYSYVNNKPLFYGDPTGFDEGDCDGDPTCSDQTPGGIPNFPTYILPDMGCGYAPNGPCRSIPEAPYVPTTPGNPVAPGPGGGGPTPPQPKVPAPPAAVPAPKKPASAQSPAHHYTIKVLTSCSAADSYAGVTAPNGSAPGAPAAQPGFTPQINLWGFESPNPISQNVDPSTMTITNTTLPGHVFNPGTVTIKVNSQGPTTSTITYEGTGNSSSPIWNDIVGYLYFGLMGSLTTLGCGMGGNPGP